jgi:hypothetical protein
MRPECNILNDESCGSLVRRHHIPAASRDRPAIQISPASGRSMDGSAAQLRPSFQLTTCSA